MNFQDIMNMLNEAENMSSNTNDFICIKCGEKNGKKVKQATWHAGICVDCKQKQYVTQRRDFI